VGAQPARHAQAERAAQKKRPPNLSPKFKAETLRICDQDKVEGTSSKRRDN